jgi:putative ABC transport system permease protein
MPGQYMLLGAPAISARVAGEAALSALVVMLIGTVSLALTWHVTRRPSLGQRAATDSNGVRVLRFGFTAGQSALAMILALGAALLLHSYANLVGQDTGFDARATVVSVSYPRDQDRATVHADVDASIARLRLLPGVRAASASIGPLIDNSMTGRSVGIDGRGASVVYTAVRPGFFDAAGMRLLQGRALADADAGTGIVINETMAHTYWPEVSPIGQIVEARASLEIVGVVADTFVSALDAPVRPTMYEVLNETRAASPTPSAVLRALPVNYLLRADGDPSSYLEPARRVVTEVNRDAIIVQMDTLGERLSYSVRDRTFATLILTLFSIAGVSVTVAGLVGIVAFIVARRTREIAIRVVVGAQRNHVRRLVTGEAIGAAATGILAGLLVGRWLSAWLESLVFGVEAGNWTTALAAAAVLLAVTVLAALAPARRAFALELTEALRSD